MLATIAPIALSLMTSSFTQVPAQPPGTPPATQPGETRPADMPNAVRAKQVLGAKIMLQGNAAAGVVDDIVFSDGGQVEYLIVNNNGKLVTVPWAALNWNWGTGAQAVTTATINITPEVYQTIPTYTVQTYPQFFVPTYRTQTYRFYNLTPGELRRIERRIDRRIP
jgi:hypothetical protein